MPPSQVVAFFAAERAGAARRPGELLGAVSWCRPTMVLSATPASSRWASSWPTIASLLGHAVGGSAEAGRAFGLRLQVGEHRASSSTTMLRPRPGGWSPSRPRSSSPTSCCMPRSLNPSHLHQPAPPLSPQHAPAGPPLGRKLRILRMHQFSASSFLQWSRFPQRLVEPSVHQQAGSRSPEVALADWPVAWPDGFASRRSSIPSACRPIRSPGVPIFEEPVPLFSDSQLMKERRSMCGCCSP